MSKCSARGCLCAMTLVMMKDEIGQADKTEF